MLLFFLSRRNKNKNKKPVGRISEGAEENFEKSEDDNTTKNPRFPQRNKKKKKDKKVRSRTESG